MASSPAKALLLIPAYVVMGATFFGGALLGPTLVFLVPVLFLPAAGIVSGFHALADYFEDPSPANCIALGFKPQLSEPKKI